MSRNLSNYSAPINYSLFVFVCLRRLYVPESIWPEMKDRMLSALSDVKMGSPLDRENLVTAVIDAKVSFLSDFKMN